MRSVATVLILLAGLVCSTGCSKTPADQASKHMKNGAGFMEKKDYSRAALEFMNAAKLAP